MLTTLKNRINSLKGSKRERSFSDSSLTTSMSQSQKPKRNEYSRPSFLRLTDDEYAESTNHETRPIIVPKTPAALPWNAGYAECICTRIKQNEDQTAVGEIKLDYQLTPDQQRSCTLQGRMAKEASLRGVYFGIFDGHGGPGAALMVADQLINHLQEKLVDVQKDLFELALQEHVEQQGEQCGVEQQGEQCGVEQQGEQCGVEQQGEQCGVEQQGEQCGVEQQGEQCGVEQQGEQRGVEQQGEQGGVEQRCAGDRVEDGPPAACTLFKCITFDDLIIGALEAAFHAMDEHIGGERASFTISGGCCTLVALFLFGRLYVANAGDCRAVAYIEGRVEPLSRDFVADEDADRIYSLARHHPELTNGHFSTSHFCRSVHKSDLGQRLLCKMPNARGWSRKEVTTADINFPLIHGCKKGSRLMNCIGVSRSLGDHDLKDVYTNLRVKPFLSATPEVTVLQLKGQALTAVDVVVMGSDGLWDMLTNHTMGQLVRTAMKEEEDTEGAHKYGQAARQAVLRARGNRDASRPGWSTASGEEPSHDDITALVIPLHQAAKFTPLTLTSE